MYSTVFIDDGAIDLNYTKDEKQWNNLWFLIVIIYEYVDLNA